MAQRIERGAAHRLRRDPPEREDAVTNLVLLDIQPLFGGHNLYLGGDGSLRIEWVTRGAGAAARVVERPPDAETLAAFTAAFLRSGFATYREHTRPGLPDEARPTIRVELRSGHVVEGSKWANDHEPRFDGLYRFLLDFIERVKARGTA